MNKSAYALLLSGLLGVGTAMAHVGTANLTLPISANGQATFAIAGGTSEIQFIVGHGCNPGETVPAPPAGLPAPGGLDTTKIEITVPAAIVTATVATSVRPSHAGEFGLVARTSNFDGSLTFLWTRNTAVAVADDQLYKVSIRLKTPAPSSATDFAIKKYQFLAKQICTHTPAGGAPTDHVMDWGTLNSPTILAFPEKRKGFNKYTLDTSTVGDFVPVTGVGIAPKLKSYFGDAAIVWIGKKGYSPNPNRSAKIDALATADKTYSNLGTDPGTTLTGTDTIWVKY